MAKPIWPLSWIPPKVSRVPWYEYPDDHIEKGITFKPEWTGITISSESPRPCPKGRPTPTPNMVVSLWTKTIEFFRRVITVPSKVFPLNFWNGKDPKSTCG